MGFGIFLGSVCAAVMELVVIGPALFDSAAEIAVAIWIPLLTLTGGFIISKAVIYFIQFFEHKNQVGADAPLVSEADPTIEFPRYKVP